MANRKFSNSTRKNAKFCTLGGLTLCVSTGCDILGQYLTSKMIKDVGHRSFKGRLRALALFSAAEMRRRGKEDLTATCKYLKNV